MQGRRVGRFEQGWGAGAAWCSTQCERWGGRGGRAEGAAERRRPKGCGGGGEGGWGRGRGNGSGRVQGRAHLSALFVCTLQPLQRAEPHSVDVPGGTLGLLRRGRAAHVRWWWRGWLLLGSRRARLQGWHACTSAPISEPATKYHCKGSVPPPPPAPHAAKLPSPIGLRCSRRTHITVSTRLTPSSLAFLRFVGRAFFVPAAAGCCATAAWAEVPGPVACCPSSRLRSTRRRHGATAGACRV